MHASACYEQMFILRHARKVRNSGSFSHNSKFFI